MGELVRGGASSGGPMHLFLDTNTYLGFYKLSGDDLEELEKLVVAVRSGKTVLYLTEQVRNEFRRNRSRTVRESLKYVEDSRLPSSFPRLLANLDGYKELREALAEYEKRRATLLDEARRQAKEARLQADGRIEELFGLSKDLPLDDEIIATATKRHDLGNPPGKKDSLGDAINWESLLAHVREGDDLTMVTADKDFQSALDESALDEFLVHEWDDRKHSAISLHTSLTALFRSRYPDIKLAADLEKELAINSLIASPNFRSTHLAISKLSNYADYTPDQVRALIAAAMTNNQISQILTDDDVKLLYAMLSDRYTKHIEPDELSWLREQLTDDDPP